MTSNQAPVRALPRAGLSLSVALLTTIRSMISPGTLLESKTWVLPGVAAMADSCGFQVTTACTLGAAKAPTMSASEVLTT